jgi:hypothetical protein
MNSNHLIVGSVLLASSFLARSATISFSEFPVGTSIYDQYASHGILFTGDSPFITTDGANPTSPVLSGTPRFFGRISGNFVDPNDPTKPVVVQSFRMDGGYFDSIGSVRIEWFDKNGVKLGQRANSKLAIENFEIRDAGGIASWSIGIFADEPAGYGIDNFSLEAVGPSVIFREKIDNDGFWFLLGDEIPGFDHVGFQIDNLVYESHPADSGRYITPTGGEFVDLQGVSGVQAQHTAATFKHYSKLRSTKVTDLEELPVNPTLAGQMKTYMEGRRTSGAGFRLLDFHSLDGISATMSPFAQKGGADNMFTCVGLVEAAAEASGHNSGQGFIRNSFESFTVPTLSGPRTIPLLSPQLLNYAMRGSASLASATQWFQGFFDPVDFIITDPIGRRLGYTKTTGTLKEIPFAFYSGDAFFEQVLIPNPLPGEYKVKFIGKGKSVTAALANADAAQAVELPMLRANVADERTVTVLSKAGIRGDVNSNGTVDQTDLTLLRAQPKSFVNDPNDPRDLNGDGIVSFADVLALERLLSPPPAGSKFAGLITTMRGKASTRPAGGAKVTGNETLYLSMGTELWAATDSLGNESTGTWQLLNKKGTGARLAFDDTTAIEATILQAARSSFGDPEASVELQTVPTILIKRTASGRYKATLKVPYIVTLESGAEKKGIYIATLNA